MTPIVKKIGVEIFLLIFTILVIRACLPEKSHLGNIEHKTSGQQIVIVPMTGIPMLFLQNLEEAIELQHQTDVLVTTAMGKGVEMLLKNSDQYDASYLANLGLDIGGRIKRKNAYIIVLTNEDINYSKSGFRYVFSSHYDGVSVISLARVNPINFGARLGLIAVPFTEEKIQQRAIKLINKALGYGLYQYEASSNINNVMYGPIMSLDDLDRVGSWYK